MKKNDNAAMAESKGKKNTSGSRISGNNTNKNQSGVASSDPIPAATAKTKAMSGRGLANEGTVVSYEEEG